MQQHCNVIKTFKSRLFLVGFFIFSSCQSDFDIIQQNAQEYCKCVHEMETGPLHLKCQKIAIRNLEDLGTDSLLISSYEHLLDSCLKD